MTQACSVFLTGPPGVGKSTIARAVAQSSLGFAAVYIENPADNPFFPPQESNEWALSQDWFLRSQQLFVDQSGQSSLQLVFDQAPQAIVNIYSQQLFEAGVLPEKDFNRQQQLLTKLLDVVDSLYTRKVCIELTAPQRILADRLEDRGMAMSYWSEELPGLVRAFAGLVGRMKQSGYEVVSIDTAGISPEEITDRILDLANI